MADYKDGPLTIRTAEITKEHIKQARANCPKDLDIEERNKYIQVASELIALGRFTNRYNDLIVMYAVNTVKSKRLQQFLKDNNLENGYQDERGKWCRHPNEQTITNCTVAIRFATEQLGLSAKTEKLFFDANDIGEISDGFDDL